MVKGKSFKHLYSRKSGRGVVSLEESPQDVWLPSDGRRAGPGPSICGGGCRRQATWKTNTSIWNCGAQISVPIFFRADGNRASSAGPHLGLSPAGTDAMRKGASLRAASPPIDDAPFRNCGGACNSSGFRKLAFFIVISRLIVRFSKPRPPPELGVIFFCPLP